MKIQYSIFVLSVLLQLFLISKTQAQCNNLGQCTTAGLPVDCVPAPFAAGGAYGAAGSFFCIGNAVGVYSTSSGNIDNSWICWGDGTDTSFVGNFTDTIYHQFGFRPDSCFSGSNGILSNTIYIFVADSCPAGCTVTWNSFPISLHFMPHAEFSFLTTGDTVCVNQPVLITCNMCTNSATPFYRWYDNGVMFDSVACPNLLPYSIQSTHVIKCVIENGCGVDSIQRTLYVEGCTGVNEINDSFAFTISPNPTRSTFTIKVNTLLISPRIDIYNVLGKEVVHRQLEVGKNEIAIDVSVLRKVIYFVKVSDEQNQNIQKLIIQ